MGEEWAREWSRWCAATRAPETPAQQYAAILLEGRGRHTQPRPTMIRGAGPDHPWDAATKEWLQAAPGPQTGWNGTCPRSSVHPSHPATEIHTWGHGAATI